MATKAKRPTPKKTKMTSKARILKLMREIRMQKATIEKLKRQIADLQHSQAAPEPDQEPKSHMRIVLAGKMNEHATHATPTNKPSKAKTSKTSKGAKR